SPPAGGRLRSCTRCSSSPPAIRPIGVMTMATQKETPSNGAVAEIPLPAPNLEPETVVEQLRVLRGHIGEVTPLTANERKQLRERGKTSNQIVQASIN